MLRTDARHGALRPRGAFDKLTLKKKVFFVKEDFIFYFLVKEKSATKEAISPMCMEDRSMLTKEEMDSVDGALREALSAEQARLGKSDDYIGKLAFGWVKSPRMKMQAIKGASTKKAQQLRLTDVVNLCEALGLSWSDEVRKALKTVKKKTS